ncbi:MAG: pilus assembly protein [Acidobacteriota bacterium]|nr:pilus assembly protein [Acidobacteriota bacterium]
MRRKELTNNENGSSIAEFAIVATIFFMLLIGIIEFGRLLYTHNALTDAARRGARYAVLHEPEVGIETDGTPQDAKCVKNVVIYGETHITPYPACDPTGPALINGIQTATIETQYAGADLDGDPDSPNPYGMNLGTATVTITGYNFNLSIPLLSRQLTMPDYTTTLTAESSGYAPPPL